MIRIELINQKFKSYFYDFLNNRVEYIDEWDKELEVILRLSDFKDIKENNETFIRFYNDKLIEVVETEKPIYTFENEKCIKLKCKNNGIFIFMKNNFLTFDNNISEEQKWIVKNYSKNLKHRDFSCSFMHIFTLKNSNIITNRSIYAIGLYNNQTDTIYNFSLNSETYNKINDNFYLNNSLQYKKDFINKNEVKNKISYMDDNGDIYEEEKENTTKVISYEFDSEFTLLKYFIIQFKKLGNDFFMTWGKEDYFVSLLGRIVSLFGENKLKELSIINKVDYSIFNDKVYYKIYGSEYLDIKSMYESTDNSNMIDYSYENVIEEKLNVDLHLEKQLSSSVIEKNHYKFLNRLAFNLLQFKLLNKKEQFIEFSQNLKLTTTSSWKELPYSSSVNNSFIYLCSKQLPNKEYCVISERYQTKGNYQGGFNSNPEEGKYNYVFSFDANSMYPNLIREFNIGFDSIHEYGEIRVLDKNISFKKGDNKNNIFRKKYSFTNNSFMSMIIDILINTRGKYKKLAKEFKEKGDQNNFEINNNKQKIYKLLTNSIYGNLNYPKSYIYNVELASIITYFGRELIQFVDEYLKSFGFKIIYNVTDSVFISFNENSDLKIHKKVNDIIKEHTSFSKENFNDETFFYNKQKIDDLLNEENLKKKLENEYIIYKLGKYIENKINESLNQFVLKYGKEKNEYLKFEMERYFEKYTISRTKNEYSGITIEYYKNKINDKCKKIKDDLYVLKDVYVKGFYSKDLPKIQKSVYPLFFNYMNFIKNKDNCENYVKKYIKNSDFKFLFEKTKLKKDFISDYEDSGMIPESVRAYLIGVSDFGFKKNEFVKSVYFIPIKKDDKNYYVGCEKKNLNLLVEQLKEKIQNNELQIDYEMIYNKLFSTITSKF